MTKPEQKTNSGAEIATLQALSQQSAAWMLGISPRSLRDHPEIPRGVDGTYDVRHLVEYAKGPGRLPELNDELFERALQIAENFDSEAVASVKAAVDALAVEIGGNRLAALAAIANVVWLDCCDSIALFPRLYEFGPADYRVVIVCEKCQRYRNGRRWKVGQPNDGRRRVGGLCPNCLNTAGRYHDFGD